MSLLASPVPLSPDRAGQPCPRSFVLDACRLSEAASSDACKLKRLLTPLRDKTDDISRSTPRDLARLYTKQIIDRADALREIEHRATVATDILSDEPVAQIGRHFLSPQRFSFSSFLPATSNPLHRACQNYLNCLLNEQRQITADLRLLQQGKPRYASYVAEIQAIHQRTAAIGTLAEKDDIHWQGQEERLRRQASNMLLRKSYFQSEALQKAEEELARVSASYVEHLDFAHKTFRHIRSIAAITSSCMSALPCVQAFGVLAGIATCLAIGIGTGTLFSGMEKGYRYLKGKPKEELFKEARKDWLHDLRDSAIGLATSLATLGFGRFFKVGESLAAFGLRRLEFLTPVLHRVLQNAFQGSFMKSMKKIEKVLPLFIAYRAQAQESANALTFSDFAEYSARQGTPLDKELKDLIFDFGVGAASGAIALPNEVTGYFAESYRSALQAGSTLGQAFLQLAGEKLKRRASKKPGDVPQVFIEKNRELLGNLFQLVVQEGAGV